MRSGACSSLLLAAFVAFLGSTGCAVAPPGSPAATPEPPPPEVEVPLEVEITAVQIRHGSLRIEATMNDGSPDVSVWTGGSCAPREIGQGISTRTGFAWSLSSSDLALALDCGLVVHAHAIDPELGRVCKVAPLDANLALSGGSRALRHVSTTILGGSRRLGFRGVRSAERLHVGGTVIGAEPVVDTSDAKASTPKASSESKESRPAIVTHDPGQPGGSGTTALPPKRRAVTLPITPSMFEVPTTELARATLTRRPVVVLDQTWDLLVTVGGVTVDFEDPEE